MKRSQWIILLALAALTAPLLGAGLVAVVGIILLPAEPIPTLIPTLTLRTAVAAVAPTVVVPLTAAPWAQATFDPTPSPETVDSLPAVEPTASETPAAPTATTTAAPIAADTSVPAIPTAVVWEPSPTFDPTATQAPIVPTALPLPTEAALPIATAIPVPTNIPAVALKASAAEHASQIFLQGKNLGNRPSAFALVGDSNTDNPNFFAPFDNGSYTLGEYVYLQETIDFFRGSFAQHSPAAVGSFNTSKVLDPAYADPARCLGNESPLVCEYRLQRPSVALILIGTGDHLDWPNFEGRYRRILEYTLSQGIIPVLLTKADDLESKEQGAPYDFTNNVIRRLSSDYDLPLLDLRLVVELLPNRGCVADGFHYNTPPDGHSADLTGNHLNYGYNVRNLTGLLVLDELRRQVLQP